MIRNTIRAGLMLWLALTVFDQPHAQTPELSCGLRPSLKIDEYGPLPPKDEQDRLEKIIPALEAEKNSHGFIVTYGGRSSRPGDAQKRADWAKRYLIEKHMWINFSEVLNARLNTLTCGYRETPVTELWVTPVAAAPPRCAPTISIAEPKSTRKNFTRRRR